MSSVRSYLTPKSSTRRVNEMGQEVCFQRPGVFLHSFREGQDAFAKLVCVDAGLGQTPDGLAHLEINVSADNFVEEVILGDDPRGK
jgi:hypothetical protein